MSAHPTSFRLPRETLAQLDRLAELLLLRQRRQRDHTTRTAGVLALDARRVTRAEALAVAVADTVTRLEQELDLADAPADPHRAAARAGRGLLGGEGAPSLGEQLGQERRRAAATEAVHERGDTSAGV